MGFNSNLNTTEVVSRNIIHTNLLATAFRRIGNVLRPNFQTINQNIAPRNIEYDVLPNPARRRFLREMLLCAGGLGLMSLACSESADIAANQSSGGTSEQDNTVNNQPNEVAVSLVDNPEMRASLEARIGVGWQEALSKNIVDASPDALGVNEENDRTTASVAATWSAAYLTEVLSGKLENPELLKKIKIVAEANGDTEFYKVLQAADMLEDGTNPSSLVKFYFEGVHGGFVVFDKEKGTWWKFVDHNYETMAGQENIVAELWKKNLNNYGVTPASEIKLKSVELNNKKFTVLRTPQIGAGSLNKLIDASMISPEQAPGMVVNYYKKALEIIKAGDVSGVHLDPHPGNLVVTDSGLVPIDFDRQTVAFEDEWVAAKAFIRKMKSYYSDPNAAKLARHSNIFVDKATFDRVFMEVMGVDPGTIPNPQKYEMPNVVFYGSRSEVSAAKAASAADQYAKGNLSQDFKWQGSEVPHSEFYKKGFLKHLPGLFEKIKPVVKVGAKILDVLAIYFTAKDIYSMIQGNAAWLYRTENLNVAEFTMNVSGLKAYLDNEILLLSSDILRTFRETNSPVANALRAVEKSLGITIPIDEPEQPTYRLFQGLVEDLVREVDIVRPITLFSTNGIPFLYGEETGHNFQIVSQGDSKSSGEQVITIAAKNGESLTPVIEFVNDSESNGLTMSQCNSGLQEYFTIEDYAGLQKLTADCSDVTFAEDGQNLKIFFRREP